MVTSEMIIEAKSVLHNLILQHWLAEELFSVKWWGTVVFILISFVIFFLLLDKRRFTEIILFGSLLTLGTVFADTVGTNFGFWTYKVRIFPTMPAFFIYVFDTVPIYYMLVYQYSLTWKKFMLWNIVLAGIISFGFFNILIALDMFETRWPLWANFLYLIIASSLARVCVLGMSAMEKKYKNKVV